MNYRFVERDHWFNHILHSSKYLTFKQIDQILDGMKEEWDDYTFKFDRHSSVQIIDNNRNVKIEPRDLTGLSLDFYIRKRISYIQNKEARETVIV